VENDLANEMVAVGIRAHMGGDTLRRVCATIVHYDRVQSGTSVCGGERMLTDGELLKEGRRGKEGTCGNIYCNSQRFV
jgi:hypothetical protein